MTDSFLLNLEPANYRIDPKHFGKWIRKQRLKQGKNQTQLARALGKSVSWVCEFENGRRGKNIADPVFYTTLADYLDLPLDTVMQESNVPKTKYDARALNIYRLMKNKALSGRILNTVDALNSGILELCASENIGSKHDRSVVHNLLANIQDLKSALDII
jgi:transcriptional regulator with XRE-family HTH domain